MLGRVSASRSRAVPAVAELEAGVRAGDRALLGRAITLVESRKPSSEQAAKRPRMKQWMHILTKPFAIDTLSERIRDLIASR